MSKKELKLKGVIDMDGAVSCLEDLVSAFKQGMVILEGEGRSLSLKPGPAVEIKIKAKSKKEKETIEIELSWPHDEELKPVHPEFKISSLEAAGKTENEVLEICECVIMTPAASAPPIVVDKKK